MQLKLLSSIVFILNLDIMKDSSVGVFESFKQMKVKPFITFFDFLASSYVKVIYLAFTGLSLSEALIFASTNQYVDRLLIKFQAQTWGEHVVHRICF